METTKSCELLMCFLLNNNCIHFISQNAETKKILRILYDEIIVADKFIKNEKESNQNFYNLKLKQILSNEKIKKQSKFHKNKLK